jgi:hypothetical protein
MPESQGLHEWAKLKIKLSKMSDDELTATWRALFPIKHDDDKIIAPGVTIFEWGELIYATLSSRNLPR